MVAMSFNPKMFDLNKLIQTVSNLDLSFIKNRKQNYKLDLPDAAQRAESWFHLAWLGSQLHEWSSSDRYVTQYLY